MARLLEALRNFSLWLLPGSAEKDPDFREEIERLGRRGLMVVALVEICAPIFMLLGRLVMRLGPIKTGPPIQHLTTVQGLCGIGLGLVTWRLSRTSWGRRWPRLLGAVSGWLTAALMLWSWFLMATIYPGAAHYLPVSIVTVLLVGVAAMPLRPMQTLALGLSIEAFALVSWWQAIRMGLIQASEWDGLMHLYILMAILLCTGLSALIYGERRNEHEAHQRAIATNKALSEAQMRVMTAENTASLGRLAGGLMHELNSPLGVLSSGVQTLLAMARKMGSGAGFDPKRMAELQNDLARSLLDSVNRLQQIVNRVRNLTNLEEAEAQLVDLNDLLGGLAGIFQDRAAQRNVQFQLELAPLPRVACRPQQISAAFNNLLSNASRAVPDGGHVRISTRTRNGSVEITFHDNGRGIAQDQLATIFNPGFAAGSHRVEARNWGLFSVRQIVLGHGGDVTVESPTGGGTMVRITLPA